MTRFYSIFVTFFFQTRRVFASLLAGKSEKFTGRWGGFCVLGLLLLTTFGVISWKSRHCFYPKRFGVVVPGQLFRSGQLSRFLVESTLREHKIRTIVDLSGLTDSNLDQKTERETANRLGIEKRGFVLRGDGTGDIEQYAAAIETLKRSLDAGKPVLVHCAAGSQRTGAAIAAYGLLFEKKSRADVLRELKTYDWSPSKDQILLHYLDSHWEELIASLVRRGVLASSPVEVPRLAEGESEDRQGPVFIGVGITD